MAPLSPSGGSPGELVHGGIADVFLLFSGDKEQKPRELASTRASNQRKVPLIKLIDEQQVAAETLHGRVDVSSGQIITFLVVGAEGFCLVGVVMGAGQKHSLHRPLAGKAVLPPARRPNNLIKAGLGQKFKLTLHSANLSPLFFNF